MAIAPQQGKATAACVERQDGQPPRVHWVDSCEWGDARTALRGLRSSHGLHRHRCVALLDRPMYRLLPLDAPDMPREEWRHAVRWQLKDMVDFPVEDAAVDVLEIPGDPARRRAPQMLAVAAALDTLKPLLAAADAVGAPWQAVDIGETALRNISALVEPEGRAQALLHVGEAHSTLVLTAGGELLMARQLAATLESLSNPDDEARERAFDDAGLELQRTLDGFDRLFSHLSLSRLLVAGGTGLEAFNAHIRELSFVPVLPLELGDTLDLSATPQLADPALLARHLGAIGAALREG